MNLRIGLTLAAALLTVGAQARPSRPVSAQDYAFVAKAAQGGAGEVSLGHLAEQRGVRPGVRHFGRHMVRDHSRANGELARVATAQGVRVQIAPGAQEIVDRQRLSRLRGPAFDRAYAALMVKDHKNDITEFQKEATQGHNPAIRAFAARTLPTLREHLRMAERLP